MTQLKIDMDNFEKDFYGKFNLMCECGHLMYQHANTWSGYGENQYFIVLQCVMCGCREFKGLNDEN